MKKSTVVDLPRVRKALQALDKLASDHPERQNQTDAKWINNLNELDRLTMGTPTKERVLNYRARLREQGYKAATIYLKDNTKDRLARLAQQTGLTYGDLIAVALERFETQEDM